MIALRNNSKRLRERTQINKTENQAFKGSTMERITSNIADSFPKITVGDKGAGLLKKLGGLKPYQQRAVVAAIELSSQPAMDWYSNRKETDETRKCSLAKTLAKIVAGASVGICTRWGTAKIWDQLAKNGKLPKELLMDKKLADGVKHTTSIAVTVISMFSVDLPLTNYLINNILKKIFPEKYKKKNKAGGKLNNG